MAMPLDPMAPTDTKLAARSTQCRTSKSLRGSTLSGSMISERLGAASLGFELKGRWCYHGFASPRRAPAC
jgi:hypothetical protein